MTQKTGTIGGDLSFSPTEAMIGLRLNVSRTSAGDLDKIKDMLSHQLGFKSLLGDALLVLLCDHFVEKNPAHILQKPGLDDLDPASDGHSGANAAN